MTETDLPSGDTLAQGRRDSQAYLANPAVARQLYLSRYACGPTVPRILREALLALPLGLLVARLLARLPAPPRLSTLGRDVLYWYGVRRGLGARSSAWRRVRAGGVPVLAYHSVPSRVDPRDRTYALPLRRFRRQMRLLHALGYRCLTPDDLIALHKRGELPEPRQVLLTFDDGYANNLQAMHVVASLGLHAIVFIVTDDLGGVARWRLDEVGPLPMLSWEQVRELRSLGVEIGSHTLTHPDLRRCSAAEARQEIEGAASAIEQALGERPRHFAYPFGWYVPETQRAVEAAGHPGAFGTQKGFSTLHDDLFALHRVHVNGDEWLPVFLLRVLLGDSPLDYLPWGRQGAWRQGPASQARARPSNGAGR